MINWMINFQTTAHSKRKRISFCLLSFAAAAEYIIFLVDVSGVNFRY